MRLLVGRAAVEGEIDVGGRLPDSRWFEKRDDATIAPSEKRPMFDEEPASEANVPAPKLIIVYSPYRQMYKPLIDIVSDLKKSHADRDIAVIIPEMIGTRWYHYVLYQE